MKRVEFRSRNTARGCNRISSNVSAGAFFKRRGGYRSGYRLERMGRIIEGKEVEATINRWTTGFQWKKECFELETVS